MNVLNYNGINLENTFFGSFAKKHQITFNPTKSKLLCLNASNAVSPHIKLNDQSAFVGHKDKHLVTTYQSLYMIAIF